MLSGFVQSAEAAPGPRFSCDWQKRAQGTALASRTAISQVQDR